MSELHPSERRPTSLRRVLAATDLGPASDHAVAAAGAIGAAFGSELIVLHAESFEVPPYFTRGQMALLEAQRREAWAAASDHVRATVARLTEHPATIVIVDGPPADAILAQVAGVDLVVMGTHGHRGARRWWLGSVAERVLRETPHPLLVLHAGDPAPAAGLFSRLQVIGGGARDEATWWADALAARLGGTVDRTAPDTCTPAHLGDASLLVVSVAREPGDTRVPAATLALLRSCPRPMLFVPVPAASATHVSLEHPQTSVDRSRAGGPAQEDS